MLGLIKVSSYVYSHTLERPTFNILLLCRTKIISLFIKHGIKKTVNGNNSLMAVQGVIHANICMNTKWSH